MEKELMNSLLFNQMMERKIFTPDQKLLALSWKQPYAELMLHGKIETRTWNTNYRGWVLICTSLKAYTWQSVQNISGEKQYQRMRNILLPYFYQNLIAYQGYAVAIGRLVDCRPMKPEDEDRCFVQYHLDLFCHIYENVQAIESFPWKGSQGWREVLEVIKKSIIVMP